MRGSTYEHTTRQCGHYIRPGAAESHVSLPEVYCAQCRQVPFDRCKWVCQVCNGSPICNGCWEAHQTKGHHPDVKEVSASSFTLDDIERIVRKLRKDRHWTNKPWNQFTGQATAAFALYTYSVVNNHIRVIGNLLVKPSELCLRGTWLKALASMTLCAAQESAEMYVGLQPTDASGSEPVVPSPHYPESLTSQAAQDNLLQLLRHVRRKSPPFRTVCKATEQYAMKPAVLAAVETAIADGYYDILGCGEDELIAYIEDCNCNFTRLQQTK